MPELENAAPTFARGVVVGKFLPPHRGHKHLIDTAKCRCARLEVLCCVKADDPIPGDLRVAWLREIHPDCEVHFVVDTLDDNDTAAWAAHTLEVLGGRPDVVFTSEDYGPPYAALMGAEHVMVDRHRETVPISATKVRASPLATWEYLEPSVRAYFCVRVVVLGAESTGTTTLSRDLAARFAAPWVGEYGRDYPVPETWRTSDFVAIAAEQARREDAAARASNGLVILDTDAFTTGVWHWRYMGHRSPEVEAIRPEHPATLTFLTGDEIPFVQDGTRDGEHIRHAMHEEFVHRLEEEGRSYFLLRGSSEQRLSEAAAIVDTCLKECGLNPSIRSSRTL